MRDVVARYNNISSLPRKELDVTAHLQSCEPMCVASFRRDGKAVTVHIGGSKKIISVELLQALNAHALGCPACSAMVEKISAQFQASAKDLAAGRYTTTRVARH